MRRICSFCGVEVECNCLYSDYGICRYNNSGESFIEFDACPECLDKITTIVKHLMIDTPSES